MFEGDRAIRRWSGVSALLLAGCAPASKEKEQEETVTEVRQHAKEADVVASARRAALNHVRESLVKEHRVSVTVRLRSDLSPAALAAARAEIEQKLTDPGSRVTYNFRSSPSMGLVVASEADLEALARNPNVENMSVAEKVRPAMNDTRGLVGANEVFLAGYDGSGRTVAVLDSGVDAAHTDLAGDIVDEACFCAAALCCPNNSYHQFGPGAAADPTGHGTHVAGIITSSGSIAPRGVAPNTKIVAVRVLEGTDTNDITAGLDWIYLSHPEVDAVNLSAGSGYGDSDDCDLELDAHADHQLLGASIQDLRDIGIITVVSSGNQGYYGNKFFLAFPACVSAAFSVGATDKYNVPAEFSMSSDALDLLAPGAGFLPPTETNPCSSGSDYCVLSTGLGNSTSRAQGTSMAAPHVTAAIALLKQANENLTVSEIEACLKAGPLATDPWLGADNRQTPRLDLLAAFAACNLPLCIPVTYEAESIYQSTGAAAPPDGWNLHSNGYVSTTHDFIAGPATVTVRALGQSAGGAAPHMVVSVNGDVIGSAFVSPTMYTDYSYTFEATAGVQEIRVTFGNDYYNGNTNPPEDRNLWLDSISVSCAEEVPPGPCDGLCANPEYMTWSGSSYNSGNLGTGAVCRETLQPVANGNCGNFAGGRQLQINGVQKVCSGANWLTPPTPRNGGYCVQTTAGNHDYAYFALW